MNVEKLPMESDEPETGVARYDEVRASEEIKVGAFLARRYPRDAEKACAQVMEICKKPAFASKGFYLFARGGKDIPGPAVGLARIFAAAWGNLLYGVEVAMDTEGGGPGKAGRRKLRGWAWDLETNTRIVMEDEFEKLIQRKVKDENGKATGATQWIIPDERDLRELTNRRGALLERNCLLKLLPPDRVDEGALRCMMAEEGEIAGYDKPAFSDTVKTAFEVFGKMRVSEAQVLARLHKQNRSELTASDMMKLRAILRGIDGGHTTVTAEFLSASTPTRSKVDDLRTSPNKPAPAKESVPPKGPGNPPPADIGPYPGVEAPPAEGGLVRGQGEPGTAGYIPDERMEADDVELHIASLINKNATKDDVAGIIKLVDYPAKKDPMNLYDGETTGNPQRQLARLARFYRNKRAEEQERESGQDE